MPPVPPRQTAAPGRGRKYGKKNRSALGDAPLAAEPPRQPGTGPLFGAVASPAGFRRRSPAPPLSRSRLAAEQLRPSTSSDGAFRRKRNAPNCGKWPRTVVGSLLLRPAARRAYAVVWHHGACSVAPLFCSLYTPAPQGRCPTSGRRQSLKCDTSARIGQCVDAGGSRVACRALCY